MSLTQWFTRSAPTVECSPISKAILSLVPTPSTLETSTGSSVLGLIHREESAKPANFTQHAAGKGLVSQILDALLGAVGAIDIHTGVSVGDRCGGGCGVLGHGLSRCLFLNPSSVGKRRVLGEAAVPKAAHCNTCGDSRLGCPVERSSTPCFVDADSLTAHP